MAERREYEQQYSSLRKSLGNFLRNNTGFQVNGPALMGSRRIGKHEDESDMDIIFSITGDPPKTEVYPKLIEKLKAGLNADAFPGSSYNVIKFRKGPLKVDLVLRTEKDYQQQKREQQLEDL